MSAFIHFRRLAHVGGEATLTLREPGGVRKVTGVVESIDDTGVVLHTASSFEYFPGSVVLAFTLNAGVVPPSSAPPRPPGLIRRDAQALQPVTRGAASTKAAPTPAPPPAVETATQASAAASIHQTLFVGRPIVGRPKVSFEIPDLDRQTKQELSHFKQMYEYAVKQNDLSRMRPRVEQIAHLAEAVNSSAMLTLAGLIGLESGHSKARAILRQAHGLRSPNASLALAGELIETEDFAEAARFLRDALFHMAPSDPDARDTAVALGRCLAQSTDRQLDGLGALADMPFPADVQPILIALVSFALGAAPPQVGTLREAVATLRTARPDSTVFNPIARPTRSGDAIDDSTHTRRGRINAYYAERGFGFIEDETNRQTIFFHHGHASPELRGALEQGGTTMLVVYSLAQRQNPDARYPAAAQVRLADAQSFPSKPAADLRVRLAALPKDGSDYSRAKRAEQLGELDKAELLFKQEIAQRGSNYKSAIKDLSSLLNRVGRPKDAIELLAKHRKGFKEKRPLDQLTVNFLMKDGQYVEAAQLLEILARTAPNRRAVGNIKRQQAYCLVAAGRHDNAIALLTPMAKGDTAAAQLLQRVRESLADKDPESNSTSLEVEFRHLAGVGRGKSELAQYAIDNCEYRGVDERSKERGYYDARDVRKVRGIYDELSGRRPKEKSDYLLTLAAICDRNPNADENRDVFHYLQRYFEQLGEAGMSDRLPADTVRCHLRESLSLAVLASEGKSVEHAASLFVGSYLPEVASPVDLLTESQFRLSAVIDKLLRTKAGLVEFAREFPHLSHQAPSAAEFIRSRIVARASDREALPARLRVASEPSESTHFTTLRGEQDSIRRLLGLRIAAVDLQQAARELDDLASGTSFHLDQLRMRELARAIRLAESYCAQPDFQEKEKLASRCREALSELDKQILRSPTKLSFEDLRKLGGHVLRLLDEDFACVVEQAKPTVELRDVLAEDYYTLDADQQLTIRLEVAVPRGCSPIEQLDIEAIESEGLTNIDPAISPQPLRGGDSRVVELRVRASAKQVEDRAFTINLRMRYRYRGGQDAEPQLASLPIRLRPDDVFSEIPNPYHSYSGGTIVSDEQMFFGRSELVDRITSVVSKGPGHCFVLYGQKRSGKSTVLHHVLKRLKVPNVGVMVTLGSLEGIGHGAGVSFIRLLLDHLFQLIEDTYGVYDVPDWPGRDEIQDTPLASFSRAVRAARRAMTPMLGLPMQVVLLIDEFTYLYEYLKEGVIDATFMRQWKGMLETGLFSAVVVGQDSMPRFKKEYANEFGVTHDERISYLTEDAAHELADRPILHDGESRYRGSALTHLLGLTACSPFYTQIVCDHLVRHLNRSRYPFITVADIELVERVLTTGAERLPVERFDPLITAAGESVAIARRDDYERILGAIAILSQDGFGAARRDLPSVDDVDRLLADMVDRDVLRRDSQDRYTIRVGLFSAWLRANWVSVAESEG